jgi:hypothetical protein
LPQEAITKCLGLVTQYNPLESAKGALIQADNCAITRENVVEDRRGYLSYLALSNLINQLFVYQSKIIAHNGTKLTFDNNGSPSDYAGSYNAPSGFKMRSVEALSNVYITTDQGVQVLTDTAGTAARRAGAPRALDPILALNSGNSGFLSAGNQCGYRVLIKRTDANSNVLFGYPSNRVLINNPTVQTTGNITNGSNQLTSLASTTGIVAGQTITGIGIPAGTTVSSISGSTVTMSNNATVTSVSTTADTTSGSNQLKNILSSLNISVGMVVSGTGIPANTTVIAINNVTSSGVTTTDVTLSANATATAAAVTITFAQPSTSITVVFGSNKNVDVQKILLPAEVTTSDIIQVYRTEQVTPSDTSQDAAGDEMALVYQTSPTSTDILNGYLALFTDSLTDSLRGASLYTSPSQESLTQANDRPPLCKDIALYKNDYMIYANISTKQRLFLTLIGVGSLTGKTITLAGVTYNFGSSEIVSGGGSPQVKVGSTGVVAADIDSTARSLVRVINQFAGNTSVYAYYQSGYADVPGQIMVEERGVGASAFTIQTSDTAIGGMFFPPPPVSPATNSASTSTNQVQKNVIAFSKAKQQEAVPALNFLPVGAANKEILRIVALRESLIVIKEEGIYRLTGETPQSFIVVPLDLTVFCKAVDSLAVLANTVFMLSNQGVVRITDTSVQVVSREIWATLKPLLSFSNVRSLTSAATYESEGQYYLSTITTSVDSAQNQIFVYNIFTRTWVRWTFGFNAAIVEPVADKLYFSKPTLKNVFKERKDFLDTDYSDPETPITITALDLVNNKVTFTIVGATPDVGWVINQGNTDLAIAEIVVGAGSYVATLEGTIPMSWVTGAANIYPPVGMQVIYDAWTGQGLAGQLKQICEIAIFSDNIPANNSATGVFPTFQSNFDQNLEEIGISIENGGWGAQWGAIPWGGSGDSVRIPNLCPSE